jgi:hypothetical protein
VPALFASVPTPEPVPRVLEPGAAEPDDPAPELDRVPVSKLDPLLMPLVMPLRIIFPVETPEE